MLEQALLDEEEHAQKPAGPSVSVGKRVDRFELVVSGGHTDERIETEGIVVEEPLPVRKQAPDAVLPDRRRVDDAARPRLPQRATRNLTNVDARIGFQDAAKFDGHVGADWTLFEHPDAAEDALAVTKRLLLGRRELFEEKVRVRIPPEQFVVGRDDVFDFRTRLRFHQRKRPGQDLAIWKKSRAGIHPRQRGTRQRTSLQNGNRLQFCGLWAQ